MVEENAAGGVEAVAFTMRKSYGFRTFRVTELALYHSLGKLPEPEFSHKILLTNHKICWAVRMARVAWPTKIAATAAKASSRTSHHSIRFR